MSTVPTERLLGLLPAVHRRRDAENGQQLRALLAVLEAELTAVEEVIRAQYENWFIETCDAAEVPRIGELLGLSTPSPAALPRILVANAIRARRRKGVPAALEAVAQDVTGWPTKVVEYFSLLAVSQHSRFPRGDRGATVNLRDRESLARHGGPFATLATRPDLRTIGSGRGRYNLADVGVFVWRGEWLTAGPVPAAPVAGRPQAFTMHPLGVDQPLAVRPHPGSANGSPGPLDLPDRITRPALAGHPAAYFGPGRSIDITIDGRSLTPDQIAAADLSNWSPPSASGALILDPELGRIVATSAVTGPIVVSYAFRAPARIGGGSYDRRVGLVGPAAGARGIAIRGVADGRDAALAAALTAPPEPGDVLTVLDDAFVADDVVITIPAGQTLVVQAADGSRPTIRGSLQVVAPHSGALVLDGFLVGGPITLVGAVALTLRHCGVPAGVRADDAGDHRLDADNSVLGPVAVGPDAAVSAVDCVIDGGQSPALHAGAVELARVTLRGPLTAERLTAADSILDGLTSIQRRQTGGLRYCYVQPGSATPARFRCQPDLAQAAGGDPQDIAARVRPRYRVGTYGAPGYSELGAGCPPEIAAGAESGSELGGYSSTLRPQREAALRAAIQEYLPAGLEAGVIDVP